MDLVWKIQNLFSFSTMIATTSSSWLDDYFDWVNPVGTPTCCRYYNYSMEEDKMPIASSIGFEVDVDVGDGQIEFCNASVVSDFCQNCRPADEENARPTPTEFYEFLEWYLNDNPTDICSKGLVAVLVSFFKLRILIVLTTEFFWPA